METIVIKEIFLGVVLGLGLSVCYTLKQIKYFNQSTGDHSNIGLDLAFFAVLIFTIFIVLYLGNTWGISMQVPRFDARIVLREYNWVTYISTIMTALLYFFIRRRRDK